MKIRVYYEDTDIGGIVYHTNYIKYCERARSEKLFCQDSTPFDNLSNSGFVVKDIKANFISTATLGDLLEVKSSILELKRVSIKLLQEVYRDDKKIFSMEILLVFMSGGRIKKIPNEMIRYFE